MLVAGQEVIPWAVFCLAIKDSFLLLVFRAMETTSLPIKAFALQGSQLYYVAGQELSGVAESQPQASLHTGLGCPS